MLGRLSNPAKAEPDNSGSVSILLNISAKDLDYLTLTKSFSSFVVVSSSKDAHYQEVGRSNMVRHSKSPTYSPDIALTYHPKENLKVRFSVHTSPDKQQAESSLDTLLGCCDTLLKTLVTSGMTLLDLYYGNDKKGLLLVQAEPLKNPKSWTTLQFSAQALPNMDFFTLSDPFLELFRIESDGDETLLYRSDVIWDNLDPEWPAFTVPQDRIEGRRLALKVWDYDKNTMHDFILRVNTSWDDILSGRREWKGSPEQTDKSVSSKSTVGRLLLKTFDPARSK